MAAINNLAQNATNDALLAMLLNRYGGGQASVVEEKSNLAYHAMRCMLALVPHRRETVEIINPATTVVLLLGCNLPNAIIHYAKYCDILPEFYVIDYAECRDKIEFITQNSSAIAHPAADFATFADRQVCIFAYRKTGPWKPGGFVETHYAASKAGVLPECVLVDICAFSGGFIDMIQQKPLPPDYFKQHCEAITRGYAAMADAESKAVYAAGIQARVAGDAGYMPVSSYRQYYHPSVSPMLGDVIIEGGIEWGLSTVEFVEIVGDAGKIIAFEPDPTVYKTLEERFQPHRNIILERQGLWSSKSTMTLDVRKDGASTLVHHISENKALCSLIDLDSYMEQSALDRCDMIKLDIEGAELETLKGGVLTLRKHRPKLAISVYHFPYEQFVHITQFLLDLDLGYTFYMGHHFPNWYETILYAQVK